MMPLPSLIVAAGAGLLALAAVTSGPVQAAATNTVARWEMNEPAGAVVMIDSSGNHLEGAIGSHVTTGKVIDGATGYGFPYLEPNTPPADPEHLITVPDDPRLDPGTADFAVTVRFRTERSFGNLIQKGQSKTSGGYFKWQMPGGRLQCLFRGSAGSVGVGTKPVLYNDGQWHTARCERTATSVILTVDGRTWRHQGWTGSISNSKGLSIAGKMSCDQIKVTCDYWVGTIDYVTIESD